MNAQSAKTHGDKPEVGVERRPAYVGDWRPGMDPNYSGPWIRDARDRDSSLPMAQAAVPSGQAFEAVQAQQSAAVLRRQLQLMPSGQRIRNLRFVLGWTQAIAAVQLGISTRTIIRHEQGLGGGTMRLSLERRLYELESIHGKELATYLAAMGSTGA